MLTGKYDVDYGNITVNKWNCRYSEWYGGKTQTRYRVL